MILRMRTKTFKLIIFLLILELVSCDDTTSNDEVNLSSDQIAKLRGFESQNHYITSEDGYIINLVRTDYQLLEHTREPSFSITGVPKAQRTL